MIHLPRSLPLVRAGNELQKLLDTSTIFRAKLIRLPIKYHISRVGHTENRVVLSKGRVKFCQVSIFCQLLRGPQCRE